MRNVAKLLFAVLLLFAAQPAFSQSAQDDADYKKMWDLIDIEQLYKAMAIGMPRAEAGVPRYQNSIAYCYVLFRNSEKALYWYNKAAAQNYCPAQYNLGYAYYSEDGERAGIPQSRETAEQWFRTAMNNTTDVKNFDTRGDAAVILSSMLKHDGDAAQGKKILEDAVALGYDKRNVPYALADMYYDHDDRVAFRLYRMAAEAGNPKAQYELAGYFKKGQFVDEDIAEATKWYQRAADHGNAAAQNELGECYECLYNKTLDERDLRKSLKYYYKSEMAPNSIFFRVKTPPKDGKLTPEFFNSWVDGDNQEDSGLLSFYKQGVMGARNYKTFGEWMENVVAKLAVDSDVDVDIPATGNTQNQQTYALIIANENYEHEQYVPYAENDGTIFARYCQNTLGVPEANIHLVTDAGLNKMKWELDWLKQNVQTQNARKVIFYYVGHGMPAENQSTSFLLPTDGFARSESSALNIKEVYDALASQKVETFIVLDACFSGAKRDGGMLVESRGVAIKSKDVKPEGKTVVLSACQGDQTAGSYAEQSHGMFTYYLLKELQSTQGNAPLGQIFNDVKTNVEKASVSVNQKPQTPSVDYSSSMTDWTSKQL